MDIRAQNDFTRAFRKAFWRKLTTWLTGERNELLPFDAVRDRIPLRGQSYLGLRTIEIDKIVGSIGRYRDFDRAFMPRQTQTKDRWIRVDSAHYDAIPLPPIEVYKLGEVYFVKDGNHRVSVARERGQLMIDAYVTEISVPITVTQETDLEDLERQKERIQFLEITNLNEIRPEAGIDFTLPGEYDRLLEHINTHRWFLGEKQEEPVHFEDAVASWYDNVYRPLVEVIRDQKLPEAFPGRTEADLYLWIIEYQWYRRAAYQEHFSLADAALDFAARYQDWPARRLVRLLKDAAWVDRMIVLQEQAAFLNRTRIQQLRPEARIEVTLPGQYEKILEHIGVHRWHLGETHGTDITFQEAVTSWYDNVYLPLVEIIRNQSILEEFPGRTETDLYLWILERQEQLTRMLGWEVDTEVAASDLAEQTRAEKESPSSTLGEIIREAVVPGELDSGPRPGSWRHERVERRRSPELFAEILIPMQVGETSWRAFTQAVVIAQRERSRLHGVHVTAGDRISEEAREIEEEFLGRTEALGVRGDFVFDTGTVTRTICQRARWTDLVVLSLNFPPAEQPLARLGSGFRQIIRRCSRPILAVPETPSELTRGLLAYDGSRTADEALYLAAFMARRWGTSISVLTVNESNVPPDSPQNARRYLEGHAIQAKYQQASGNAADRILEAAERDACNFILIGGYGHHPVIEFVVGSTLDQVLRESRIPMLISK